MSRFLKSDGRPARWSDHARMPDRTVAAALVLIGLAGCEYGRDVRAELSGPSTVRVGEVIQLAVTLRFSDGTSNLLQPSQIASVVFESSNASVLTVSPLGEARGLSPGTATIAATPSVTSTGTGKRTPGTLVIQVIP